MARVQNLGSHRLHNTVQQSHENDGTTASRSSTRPARHIIGNTAAQIHTNIKPAAFPSLPTDQATPGDQVAPEDVHEYGRRGLSQCMKARKEGLQSLRENFLRIDLMYKNNEFPSTMEKREKAWYAELNGC
jgi:hypothetical protein